jgi:hypothetical protein
MGQDLEGIMNSGLGQPMAQIFFNSFGKEGTLAMWSFIIIAQYMMGSSLVRFAVPSLAPAVSCVWADNHFRCLLPHANLSPCRLHILATQQLSDYFTVAAQCAGRCPSILQLALPHERLHQDASEQCLVLCLWRHSSRCARVRGHSSN